MALPRLSAYAVAGVVAALVAAGVALLVAAPDRGAAVYFGVGAALGLASTALGILVATHRPENLVGTLLVLVGSVAVWLVFGDSYAGVVGRRPGLLPVSDLFVGLSPGTWMFLYVPPALLMLYFPDGRLPGPRWRWVAGGLLVVPGIFTLLAALDPTPFPPPFENVAHAFGTPPEPYRTVLTVVAIGLLPVLLGLLVASAAAIVVRYRRATDDVRRAQLKWFALGAAFLPAALLLCWASYLFFDGPDLVLVGLAATYLAIPVATAIAMLRHDLYDVDRAISAAVTYGFVTAGLLGFYTAASFVVGLGAGRASPVAAAAATAVCAAALAPLRRRLQRWIDRRLYPARRAALAAIEDLQGRTHAGTAHPEQLEAALRAALRDPALRVGYRLPGEAGEAGEAGLIDVTGAAIDPGNAYCAPVRLGGHEIGAIVRGSVGSRELLREVAAAGVLLVEVVRLRIELNRALQDVESSRARLLHAGYEERRRLERDLHDDHLGVQRRPAGPGHLGRGPSAGARRPALPGPAPRRLGSACRFSRRARLGLRSSAPGRWLPAAIAAAPVVADSPRPRHSGAWPNPSRRRRSPPPSRAPGTWPTPAWPPPASSRSGSTGRSSWRATRASARPPSPRRWPRRPASS